MDSQDRHSPTAVAELSRDCVLQPPVLELLATEIHIWEFPLTTADSEVGAYATLLSEDERTRASRFRFERDARHFTVARASMRSILGGYTGSAARDLRFNYSQYGKPSFANVTWDVRFNVSHSADLAMLAVVRGREVGVDLETIRAEVETDKLAERFFSVQERESLRALPNQDRISAFFRCWTCKEAFLKAQGLGLSRSLESFDVEVNPQLPAHILATRPDPEEAGRWSLRDVETVPEYAAAVAMEGDATTVKIFRCR